MGKDEIFCKHCGTKLTSKEMICPTCGLENKVKDTRKEMKETKKVRINLGEMSKKKYLLAQILISVGLGVFLFIVLFFRFYKF